MSTDAISGAISPEADLDEKRRAGNRERTRRSYLKRRFDPAFIEKQQRWKQTSLERIGGPVARKAQKREWYLANREKVAATNANYRKSHPEVRREQARLWAVNNPERKAAHKRKHAVAVRTRKESEALEYFEANKTEILAAKAERRQQQAEATKMTMKARNEHHKRQFGVSYVTTRRRENPYLMLRARLDARVKKLIKKGLLSAKPKTDAVIGCSGVELCFHIEGLFLPGMTWGNRRLWHIDHVRPCNTFDLLDPAQQATCFHYSNLRPLWAQDNMRRPRDGSDIKLLAMSVATSRDAGVEN